MYNDIVRSFDSDIHTRYVEDITERHPAKMFSMFKSEIYHEKVLYSCERICVRNVNGLICRKSNRERPELVGFDIKAEDPRLVVCNDKVYIVFNRSRGSSLFPRCMAISLFDEWNPITLEIKNTTSSVRQKNEKNWSPFVKNNTLHFVYTFDPLVILTYDFNTKGECIVIHGPEGTFPNTENAYLRGGSNLIPYKDDYYIGACHSRVQGELMWAYHTHIIIMDMSCFRIVHMSKPVAFRHETQGTFIAQGPCDRNERYRIKFIREMIFPLGRIPISEEDHIIMSPCSMYMMDGKIYMTVNIQDSITLRYEILVNVHEFNEPKNLNAIAQVCATDLFSKIPIKAQRKKTKACYFA